MRDQPTRSGHGRSSICAKRFVAAVVEDDRRCPASARIPVDLLHQTPRDQIG
jgi:hypothetical protein